MPEEKYTSINEAIGKIVLKTSYLHVMAAQIISYYYQGNNDNHYRVSLTHDVLTNERASFSFITESLKRVLINLDNKDFFEKNIESKMRQIGNLRNEFAHEVPLYNKIHYLRDKKALPFHGEGKEFEKKFDTFELLHNEISEALNKIMKDMSIKTVYYILDGYKPPKEGFNSSK